MKLSDSSCLQLLLRSCTLSAMIGWNSYYVICILTYFYKRLILIPSMLFHHFLNVLAMN